MIIVLDSEFDPGIALERNPDTGTLRVYLNTKNGTVALTIHIHPHLAQLMRDRLNMLYPSDGAGGSRKPTPEAT